MAVPRTRAEIPHLPITEAVRSIVRLALQEDVGRSDPYDYHRANQYADNNEKADQKFRTFIRHKTSFRQERQASGVKRNFLPADLSRSSLNRAVYLPR